MVDRDLVLRKLADLEQYVGRVSEYRGIDARTYREDWKTQRIVDRTLQMAIEVCVDVANHVIADRGLRVPATYGEAFDVLVEAGLLGREDRDASSSARIPSAKPALPPSSMLVKVRGFLARPRRSPR